MYYDFAVGYVQSVLNQRPRVKLNRRVYNLRSTVAVSVSWTFSIPVFALQPDRWLVISLPSACSPPTTRPAATDADAVAALKPALATLMVTLIESLRLRPVREAVLEGHDSVEQLAT